MVSVIATAGLSHPGSQPLAPVQHQYGTRIRSNSIIRPSARLRQSPDPPAPPRRIKPVPVPKAKAVAIAAEAPQIDMPIFPPPHVMLHADDATSKVFIAIGRSFMSVDNRAMTIKDLAEMTIRFGLLCQNVSAAGQAITTYIRNHLQRCEVQQDHPLLLRHTLSGTPSDDDLVPALYSRVGGAHCMLNASDNRVTNFRRGTMVWYLSKAAGAPCPFSRAGIRLCDYTENGRVGSQVNPGKERKRERDRMRRAEQCGQKRKRLMRACADKGSDSESSEDEEETRPPKVKLTLRLKPCAASSSISPTICPSGPSQSNQYTDRSKDSDSDSDSMSVDTSEGESETTSPEACWSLPPYPRRSISIPCYTPSLDGPHAAFSPYYRSTWDPQTTYHRSPSVPLSAVSASPPPDSEEEADDFHISMTGGRRVSSGRARNVSVGLCSDDATATGDVFADIPVETETHWGSSPGPRSPSAPFEDEEILVKQEPRDVRDLLDAWENLDSRVAELKVVDVVAQAAAGLGAENDAKVIQADPWDWHEFAGSSVDGFAGSLDEDGAIHIKLEEVDPTLPPSPLSPLGSQVCGWPTRTEVHATFHGCSELTWKDVELLGPDSLQPHDLEDSIWPEGVGGRGRRIRSIHENLSTSVPSESVMPPYPQDCTVHPPLLLQKPRPSPTEFATPESLDGSASLQSSFALRLPGPMRPELRQEKETIATQSVLGPSTPTAVTSESASGENDRVSVHPCQPCVPPICATRLEGISVYQMTLGSSLILRRIDTDFVNVSPLSKSLGLTCPSPSTIPAATTVSMGSSIICGTWVPLAAARKMVQEDALLRTFLSDELHELFPSALQDFRLSDAQSRSSNQFGPHFRSTLAAKRESLTSHKLDLPSREIDDLWERGVISHWDVEDHLLSVHTPFTLASAILSTASFSPEDTVPVETPLSPMEEEMFHTLCSAPDWETSDPVYPVPLPCSAQDHTDSTVNDSQCVELRQLRRSKRVANAQAVVASRSRTRSRRRGSRSSLS